MLPAGSTEEMVLTSGQRIRDTALRGRTALSSLLLALPCLHDGQQPTLAGPPLRASRQLAMQSARLMDLVPIVTMLAK